MQPAISPEMITGAFQLVVYCFTFVVAVFSALFCAHT